MFWNNFRKLISGERTTEKKRKFEELEVVSVLRDFINQGVRKGDVGTIVHVYNIPNEAYEVEFSSEAAKIPILLTILPDDLERLGK